MPGPLAVRRHRFRAMGTAVELVAEAVAEARAFALAAQRTEETFEREERRCSRFRDDSELTLVNLGAGLPTRLSPGLAEIVGFALEAAAGTHGRFDPTVLDAVIAAGYDRDFDEVLAGARGALHPARPCGRWREVRLDEGVLRLPEGVGLDLGGVAKGWTVDLAAAAALDAGLGWVVVNAGGDVRLAGHPPTGVVDVGIEDPGSPDVEMLRVGLSHGALATSSITRRAWGPDLHHLIDPSTGAPAATGVLQATAWAPTCAEAEIRAKDALLLGEEALERIPVALVMADGRMLLSLADRVEAAA